MSPTGTEQRDGSVRTAAALIALVVLVMLLWHTRTLILTVFLGVLFALAVSSGVDRLQRWRVPRGVAAPLIVLVCVGLLGGFGSWIGPTVREQTVELRTKLPEALGKLELWVRSRGGGIIATITGLSEDSLPRGSAPNVAPTPPDSAAAGLPVVPPTNATGTSLRDRLLAQLGGVGRYFLPVISSTLAVFAGIMLVLFLAIYLAIDPGIYRRGVLRVVPKARRAKADKVFGAIAVTLRKWLVTQLIAMVVIGVVTTGVLLALNVRAAIPLGILAGLLEFVPTLGPILSALPAIAMGFVDSPEKALAVTVAYVGIQFLENQLLIPILMKEEIGLPPALTIVMQALMAIVFGILGLLVAVPLLATVMIAVRTATDTDSG